MDPIEMREKKNSARQRLQAQRRRAGELRGRVVAISVTCFVLLWAVVFVQMATGNDPVLGDSSKARTARAEVRKGAEPEALQPETFEAEPVEEEFFAEEPEAVEEEAFVEEPEAVEEEAFVEEPEPEPLTTSQS